MSQGSIDSTGGVHLDIEGDGSEENLLLDIGRSRLQEPKKSQRFAKGARRGDAGQPYEALLALLGYRIEDGARRTWTSGLPICTTEAF